MKKSKKLVSILLFTLWGLLLMIGCLIHRGATWVEQVYGVQFTELLFTLTSPLNGTGGDMVWVTIQGVLFPVLPTLFIYIFAVWLFAFSLPKYLSLALKVRLFRLQFSLKPLKLIHLVAPVAAIAMCVAGLLHADETTGMFDYIESVMSRSTIYETYYVEPADVTLTPPAQKKNLLLIYQESMETTYASYEDGGWQKENYMPNMTRLAQENISFSNTDKLGGFRMTGPTTWTMAALFATGSGLPFSFPVGGNNMGQYTKFASGVTALGDILLQEGYSNEFLCGSDVSFAGRKQFYEQHGNHTLYDLFTARENGVIAEDYFEFWGFEDAILYEIAKDELTRLSQQEQPFNLTMLTVDPHHTGGYTCKLCGSDYENPTANVIACADRQLNEFLLWCEQQPFYEDTVIVITGDHPRMDTILVDHVPRFERTMYNCFINSQAALLSDTKNREFAPMDMFPTILAALGYQIPGDRLALGTNLFSQRQTLTEELGHDAYSRELSKYSVFFAQHFY